MGVAGTRNVLGASAVLHSNDTFHNHLCTQQHSGLSSASHLKERTASIGTNNVDTKDSVGLFIGEYLYHALGVVDAASPRVCRERK